MSFHSFYRCGVNKTFRHKNDSFQRQRPTFLQMTIQFTPP